MIECHDGADVWRDESIDEIVSGRRGSSRGDRSGEKVPSHLRSVFASTIPGAMTHRPLLSADKVSPEVHSLVSSFHRNIVDEVAATVARDPVVVVGMAQNPVVKAARKLLDQEGITYKYLEYGSYFSQWKQRLAIKLWAGFPTFPMVFIDGVLVGGNSELVKLKEAGKLKK
jgi:glutaredoxin-related protein